MTQKNFYETLGVSKTADEATIKKAYRKLIRQYHPDVSKEPDAEARTAEINTAYENLSDKNKRAEYDAMLNNPFAGQGFTGNQGFSGAGGFDFNGFNGASGGFDFEDIISAFSGQRRHNPRAPRKGEDEHATLTVDVAIAYTGKTSTINLQVNGVQKALKVTIPKGLEDGQKIRLKGQGQAGINGGDNGDLYLTIRYRSTAEREIKNAKDIHQRLDVWVWDAAIGAKQIVMLPTGRKQITLPKNSQNGQKIRLKGQGIPSKQPGDFYFTVNLRLPNTTTDDADVAVWQGVAKHFNAKASA